MLIAGFAGSKGVSTIEILKNEEEKLDTRDFSVVRSPPLSIVTQHQRMIISMYGEAPVPAALAGDDWIGYRGAPAVSLSSIRRLIEAALARVENSRATSGVIGDLSFIFDMKREATSLARIRFIKGYKKVMEVKLSSASVAAGPPRVILSSRSRILLDESLYPRYAGRVLGGLHRVRVEIYSPEEIEAAASRIEEEEGETQRAPAVRLLQTLYANYEGEIEVPSKIPYIAVVSGPVAAIGDVELYQYQYLSMTPVYYISQADTSQASRKVRIGSEEISFEAPEGYEELVLIPSALHDLADVTYPVLDIGSKWLSLYVGKGDDGARLFMISIIPGYYIKIEITRNEGESGIAYISQPLNLPLTLVTEPGYIMSVTHNLEMRNEDYIDRETWNRVVAKLLEAGYMTTVL